MFLRKEILLIIVLNLTEHIVSNKNIPAASKDNSYNIYEENKHLQNNLKDKPTFIIVVLRKNVPKSEHYTKIEYANEIISEKPDADNVLSKNGVPIRVGYVIVRSNNVVGDPKDFLRKKKKKKKKDKKKRPCKYACKVAVKTVCEDIDCSKKKKKTIARSCLKKCKKKTD